MINLQENIKNKIEEALKANLIKPKENRASILVKLLKDEIIELNKFKSYKEIIEEINNEYGLSINHNSLQRALLRSVKYRKKGEVKTKEKEVVEIDSVDDQLDVLDNTWIDDLDVSEHFKNSVKNSGISQEEFLNLNLNLKEQVKALSIINDLVDNKNSLGNKIYKS